MKKKLKIPPDSYSGNKYYKQVHEGSCGPNAMRKIIYYKKGLDIPEQYLINISGCSQKNGASVKGILKIADTFKLNYRLKHNSSIQDLVDSIIDNTPAILLIQAWPSHKVLDWSNINHLGHYIDIFGFDTLKEKISYYDPYDGKEKEISYKNLDERWHDLNLRGKISYNHFGIFF